MAKRVNAPESSTSKSGRMTLMPVVLSHWLPQSDRSRPDDFSSAASRSENVALPNLCEVK
ncbi:Uncharacterised protein [Mycobacteroides abscessus subsp. abscessus]|nr:Uncharacterised protein [Mycobacteroides abscessus subsp. abscessus]